MVVGAGPFQHVTLVNISWNLDVFVAHYICVVMGSTRAYYGACIQNFPTGSRRYVKGINKCTVHNETATDWLGNFIAVGSLAN